MGERLTIGKIYWLRIRAPPNHCKFYLLKVLALQASAFFQPFLGIREFLVLVKLIRLPGTTGDTYRNYLKDEWNSM